MPPIVGIIISAKWHATCFVFICILLVLVCFSIQLIYLDARTNEWSIFNLAMHVHYRVEHFRRKDLEIGLEVEDFRQVLPARRHCRVMYGQTAEVLLAGGRREGRDLHRLHHPAGGNCLPSCLVHPGCRGGGKEEGEMLRHAPFFFFLSFSRASAERIREGRYVCRIRIRKG